MSELNIQNITLFIAIWGAVLSTYKIVSDYQSKKRKVKVKITNGFIAQGNEVSPQTLNISAINTGLKDVTLHSVGFLFPNDIWSVMVEHNGLTFPHKLAEGTQCNVWKFCWQLANEFRRHGYNGIIDIRGYYRSATGDFYKSKPFKFNVDKDWTQE